MEHKEGKSAGGFGEFELLELSELFERSSFCEVWPGEVKE